MHRVEIEINAAAVDGFPDVGVIGKFLIDLAVEFLQLILVRERPAVSGPELISEIRLGEDLPRSASDFKGLVGRAVGIRFRALCRWLRS